MADRAKRHLLPGSRTRAACGLLNPRSWSKDPAEVTCEACKRTLLMADAEVKKLNKQSI